MQIQNRLDGLAWLVDTGDTQEKFLNPNICIYIYFDMRELPCLCSNVRRTARAMTQLYEEALRPLGLRSSQFTILQVLERTGEVAQGRLSEILAMDSTTLTRTIAIMLREGWVAERRGEDRRERWLRLSKTGEAQMKRAVPAWERVQARVWRQLGEEKWRELFQLTTRLAELSLERVQ
jgi:DNA-binding MarR family transcriptional regulator